ncbi:MAG: hypothetical protein Q8O10_10280 [candidate division Zixibacteria bacterium]|nr:hypothetical protein [candidate division Zixibacteria bacterium]
MSKKAKKKKRVIEYTHWEFDRDGLTALLFNGDEEVAGFPIDVLMEIALEFYEWENREYKEVSGNEKD